VYYYRFHLRDYVAKTRHLSLIEDLAYRRLLDAYYTQEGALPLDFAACARLIAMRDHVAEIEAVLIEFFDKTDAGWVNERAEEEIARYHLMEAGARKGAAKRWAKAGQTDGNAQGIPQGNGEGNAQGIRESNADALPTNNQEPITKNTPQPPSDYEFDSFWRVYPKKDGKAPAKKAWIKLKPDADLRARIIDYVKAKAGTKDWFKENGQFVPMATTFLNQARWEDEESLTEDKWDQWARGGV
jgi:uncharacterized protein YdaU (DUF1376 family)